MPGKPTEQTQARSAASAGSSVDPDGPKQRLDDDKQAGIGATGVAGACDSVRRSAMRWLMQFYNERLGILARYGIEAPLPAAAARLGLKAVLAEYPSPPRKGRLSLFERAERIGGQDASGWVLYRIVKENGHASPDAVSAHAA
jgi:hypothetical protein